VGKLVRDRIPEVIRAGGQEAHVRTLSVSEYRRALREKLNEEVGELLTAKPAQVAEEIADVIEVLIAIAAVSGSSWEHIEQVRTNKASERGAFARRLWLEDVHQVSVTLTDHSSDMAPD
jgi:predicted house-cleaning noncanonical NTP pyrophosphatase (MazG superfamily)